MLALLLLVAPARAQSPVDRAVALFEEGDLEGALAAFEAAERADAGVSRGELLRLLVHRSLVYHALEDAERMQIELFKLATLEPRFDLGDATPPPVREAFAEQSRRVSRALSVDVSARETAAGIAVGARSIGDDAGLVRRVRLAARLPGERFREGDGELRFDAGADRIEYFAELVGPGGAVLARAGTARRPSVIDLNASEATESEQDGSAAGLWIGITLGALAIAGLTTLAILVFVVPVEHETLGPPTLDP